MSSSCVCKIKNKKLFFAKTEKFRKFGLCGQAESEKKAKKFFFSDPNNMGIKRTVMTRGFQKYPSFYFLPICEVRNGQKPHF